MNTLSSIAATTRSSLSRHARRMAVIGFVALALPTAQAGPWTSVGSAGTIDEDAFVITGPSPGMRAVMSGAAIGIPSALAQQTVRVRYNVVDVFGRNGLAYPALGANFVDNGASANVAIHLFEQNITSTAPRLLLSLNSNSFPASGVPQARSIGSGCAFTLDFKRNAYWIEAVLTRTATGGTPVLNEVRVVDQVLC